ncbi:hypothetical protein [Promicromonospora sukumoe]|uniref:PH-like domain-containing protein n=1 Tax=Promicromonospora sukumoe TaxID=88382 RepID=UPI0036507FBC
MKILSIALLVVLAVFLVLFVTLIGRRRLAQRTTTVVPVPPRPIQTPGDVRFGPVEAVYVSTTLHGDWLARVGAHGLGDRSHAAVTVHGSGSGHGGGSGHDGGQSGVLIERDGADDLWVPVETIRSAGLAPGMAGKYVGTDGLVVLTWAVPEADGVAPALVDTGLRTRRAEDRGGLVDAVHHLLAATQQAQQAQQAQQYPEQQYPHQQEAR